MITGIISLCLAYVLSQFFRSFLAVLTGILGQDIGATPDDLSTASGLWFLSFALMQIPVGGALDRIGPRLTSAVLFLIGGAGGAALFAMAQSALHVKLAMLLLAIWLDLCRWFGLYKFMGGAKRCGVWQLLVRLSPSLHLYLYEIPLSLRQRRLGDFRTF